MSKKEPWNSVGIEVEYTDIIPHVHEELMMFLERNNLNLVHDASVESPCLTLHGKPIKGKTFDVAINKALMQQKTIGGEIVSLIIGTENDDWIACYDELFSLLKRAGERARTNRGSIHVHVNFPNDHKKLNRHTIGILKRAWMLAGYFEWAFYKIGGLGREHRGIHMDYIYYRPITGNGPHIVRCPGGRKRPLLIYGDVLNSKTQTEFLVRCGDIVNANGRYHPCRYMWINFRNTRNEHPDLEFRLFNKTLRWDYLYAVVELCKGFVKTCYDKSTKQMINLLGEEVNSLENGVENQSEHLNFLLTTLDIEKRAGEIIRDIWDRTPDPEYDDYPVFCHLRNDYNIFHTDDYYHFYPTRMSLDDLKKVRAPNFLDSHSLGGAGINIFPEEIN